MNKRVLLLSGGLFTVLLATVAIISTYNDQSSFQASSAASAESLKILSQEQSTVFQEEIQTSAQSTSKASQMSVSRIQNSVVQLYKDMINPSTLRLTAIPSTDRLVYRAGDYMFVEVLLFDTLKKSPYILPTTTPPTIKAIASLVDSSSATVATVTGTLAANKPSISFVFKIPAGQAVGSYSVVISNDVSVAANARAFPTVYRTVQVRAVVTDAASSGVVNTLKVFGRTQTVKSTDTTGTIYGKIQSTTAGCVGKALTITPSYIAKDNLSPSAETAATGTLKFTADNSYYFTFTYQVANVQMSRDNTLVITAVGADAACTFTTVLQVPITIVTAAVTYTNNQATADFFTEANTDLVYNVTQKVYFNTYFLNVASRNSDLSMNSFTTQPINVVAGSIKAYKISDPYSTLLTLVAAVNSDVSGYGSFSMNLPDGYMPFLEFVVPGHTAETGNKFGVTLPYSSTVDLPGGIVRIPIKPNSIASELKTLKYSELSTTQSGVLLAEALKNLAFTVTDTTAPAGYGAATGLTYILDNGVFIIQDTNQYPLVKFNQFPNPSNFTNTVLFSYFMEYPNEASGDYSQISVSVKSYDFKKVIQQLAHYTIDQIQTFANGKAYTASLGYDYATAHTGVDATILKLCTLFEAVSFRPYAEITLFNEFGPQASKVDGSNGYAYSGNSIYSSVTFETSSINFSLNSRVLESQDDLVITFSTNTLMDPTKAYLLAIKQKEQVLYTEAFSFSQNSNSKRTIPYGKLNQLNGGVFSVDLYRITDFWYTFQTSTAFSMCDITAFEAYTTLIATNAAKSPPVVTTWAGDDKAELIALDSYESFAEFNTIDKVTRRNKFTPATSGFSACILDSPYLATQFLTHVGSSQFYRRPQPAIDVTVATTKSEYYQGETITVTVNTKNSSTAAAISSGAYLSVVVTEELQYTEFSNYVRSVANDLYARGDIGKENIPFSIQQVIDKPYDNTIVAANSILEHYMARQRNLYRIYEVDTMTNVQYLNTYQQSTLPLQLYQLRRAYGFNFDETEYGLTAVNTNTNAFNFKQTDLTEFIKPVTANTETYQTILGYKRSFPRSTTQQTTNDPLAAAFATTPAQVSSVYSQSTYTKNTGTYTRETLYFQSGVPITSGTTSFTFKAGDLPSSYKVKAVVVSANGIGFDDSTFTISKPFNVDIKYPSVMVVGETYACTATVTNFSPDNINVALTSNPVTQVSTKISATFGTSTVTSANGVTPVTYSWKQTKTITPGQDTFTISVTALAEATTADTITLDFKASLASDATNAVIYSQSVPITATVTVAKPLRTGYGSGSISTNAASNTDTYHFLTPHSSSNFYSVNSKVSLLSGRFAMVQKKIPSIVDGADTQYVSALDLVNDINTLALQIMNVEPTANTVAKIGSTNSFGVAARRNLAGTAQSYKYQDRIPEFSNRIKELYSLLQTKYSVKIAGKCAGWDYFSNTSPTGGSLTLTSHILSILTDVAPIIYSDGTAAGQYVDKATCYQESLAWILSKQVYDNNLDTFVGNFTFSPLDVDALGRAPWNVSQAIITYNLLNTLQVQSSGAPQTPDLYQQVLFLQKQVSASFTAASSWVNTNNGDPYYLSLGYLTISRYFQVLVATNPFVANSANANIQEYNTVAATQNQALKTAAGLYIDELQYYQFADNKFGAVSGNYSFDSMQPYKKSPYTAFNSYNNDRVVEVTAVVVQALIDSKTWLTKNTDAIAKLAVAYLKKNYRNQNFGSVPATYAALNAITAYETSTLAPFVVGKSYNPWDAAQTLTFTAKRNHPVGTTISTSTITDDFAIPQTYQLVSGDLGFAIDTDYEISMKLETDTPAVDSFYTWAAETSYWDETYLGPAEVDRKIALEVYANAGELASGLLNSVVKYQISLLNLDRGRTHNGAYFIIRPSPCLLINSADLDLAVTRGDFHGYRIDETNHRVIIYVRGVSPFGFPTFTLGFKKIYTGTCIPRPHTVYLSQSVQSFAHAFPREI